MDDMLELRCKYCGAPLDREDVESDSAYVTCRSCGTTQQRVDAKAYMQQMMGQIQSWISKSIPGGFTLSQTQNVDPVARHNIFVNDVKPAIDPEISDYRLGLNSAIANPLIVLPFTKGSPMRTNHSSQQAFEFNAKLKSIEPLAVDDQYRRMILDAENMSSAYALLINNSNLLTDTTPGRFALMANNFTESASSVAKVEEYAPLAMRLQALAEICTASDMILNGDVLGCSVKMEQGVNALEKSKMDIMMAPRLAVMLRAVDIEISQAKTLLDVTSLVTNGTSKDPLQLLETLNRVTGLQYPNVQGWNCLANKERSSELFKNIEEIVSARNGGNLPICAGSGDVLYPFWDIDLKYSFTTGTLFSKKTVEVTEDILVPATFTMSGTALSNPRHGLTDIFAAAPESSILSKIKGEESSISGGAGIGRLTDSASPNGPASRKVVVPLCTRMEATRLVQEYLRQCSSSHSKLKLSRPEVKRLIYIPCTLNGSQVELPSEFNGLVPGSVKELGTSGIVVI